MLIVEKHYQPKTHGYKLQTEKYIIYVCKLEESVSALYAGICPQEEEGGA